LSGVVVNAVRTSTGVAGTAAAEATFTGQRGEYVYDTTNGKLIVNVTSDASISGADYQIGVNAATTAANTIGTGDVNVTVTGTGYADTIVTGGGDDTINGGAAVDTITGGAGADTINTGASDSAADIVRYTAGTEGATTVTVDNTNDDADFTATAGTTTDSITNQFVVGTDLIKIVNSSMGLAQTGVGLSSSTNSGNWDMSAVGIWIIDDTPLSGNDFGDISDLTTATTTGFGTKVNGTAGDAFIFTIENAAGTQTGIYYWVDNDGDGLISDDDELALLAIVADADFVISTVTFE